LVLLWDAVISRFREASTHIVCIAIRPFMSSELFRFRWKRRVNSVVDAARGDFVPLASFYRSLDMLLAQIPHQHKEKIAAEIGSNIGVLSGKVGSETKPLDSRMSHVFAVERYIRNRASGETLDNFRLAEIRAGSMPSAEITCYKPT
jgi:hypothetical protein